MKTGRKPSIILRFLYTKRHFPPNAPCCWRHQTLLWFTERKPQHYSCSYSNSSKEKEDYTQWNCQRHTQSDLNSECFSLELAAKQGWKAQNFLLINAYITDNRWYLCKTESKKLGRNFKCSKDTVIFNINLLIFSDYQLFKKK